MLGAPRPLKPAPGPSSAPPPLRRAAARCIIPGLVPRSPDGQHQWTQAGHPDSPRLTGLLGYTLSLLLVALPLVDTTASLAPLRPGDPTWRVGAVGLLSRSLLLPAAGALLAYVTARRLEHAKVLRALATISAAASLALLAAIGLFALDALETRGLVDPGERRALDIVSLIAVAKLAAFLFLAIVLALAAWHSARRTARERRETPTLVSGVGRGESGPQA